MDLETPSNDEQVEVAALAGILEKLASHVKLMALSKESINKIAKQIASTDEFCKSTEYALDKAKLERLRFPVVSIGHKKYVPAIVEDGFIRNTAYVESAVQHDLDGI